LISAGSVHSNHAIEIDPRPDIFGRSLFPTRN
jgi:hypothetical protein